MQGSKAENRPQIFNYFDREERATHRDLCIGQWFLWQEIEQ